MKRVEVDRDPERGLHLLGGGHVTDPHGIEDARLVLHRYAEEPRQAEGPGHQGLDGVGVALIGDGGDDLAQHPVASRRVVHEARPGVEGEPPPGERLQPPGAGLPGGRPQRGVRKPPGVGEDLLDGDHVLAVRGELGHVAGTRRIQVHVTTVDQLPDGPRYQRLGGTEGHEAAVVGGPEGGVHQQLTPVADGHLGSG